MSKGQLIVLKKMQYMVAWAEGDTAKTERLAKEIKAMYKYKPSPELDKPNANQIY